MIIPSVDPVAFTIANTPIYWYGICMAFAIFVAIVTANKLSNLMNMDHIKKDLILSYSPIIILCGILGARLYFCMLNLPHYISHPIEILDIRQGGLSIHGALIFGILSLLFVALKHKVSLLRLLDAMGCATILGQSIGRWGNYFNSEAYGLPVNSQLWGLFIPEAKRLPAYADFSLFHPTFLYESVLDLFGFIILMHIYRKVFVHYKYGNRYSGLFFFSYLAIYSVIRFFIEQIRIDSAFNVGSFPIAEVVSGVLFLIGIIGIFTILAKTKIPKT